jgi:hypothetical protein
MKEYLFYTVLASEATPPFQRHFDMEKVEIIYDFKKFVKDSSSLKKVVYLEEHKVANDSLFNDERFKKLNALFLVNFSDGTSIYTIEKLKKWIEINQISEEKILVMAHSEHDVDLIKSIIKTNINFAIVPGPLLIVLHEFLTKKFKKRFLFLSRNWHNTRLVSFVDLRRRGILNNSYYSFFNVKNIYADNRIEPRQYYSLEEIDTIFKNSIADISAKNPIWGNELNEYWNDEKTEIVRSMPCLLENESKEIPPGQQFISNTLQDAFINSAMSLLVETNNYDISSHFQCTEKTYKSMMYRHPFFVYATENHLSRTRQHGFKTFSNVFDESYDTLNTAWERIYHIHNQVDHLNRMSDNEFKKIIYKTIPETTHNYNVVMNRLANIKSGITYKKFNKDFDNLLLNNPPDHWFNNAY